MTKSAATRIECKGAVKYCSFYDGNIPWKTGSLILERGHKDWLLYIKLSVVNNPLLGKIVRRQYLKKFFATSNRLWVELSDGSIFQLKTVDNNFKDLNQFHEILKEISNSSNIGEDISSKSRAMKYEDVSSKSLTVKYEDVPSKSRATKYDDVLSKSCTMKCEDVPSKSCIMSYDVCNKSNSHPKVDEAIDGYQSNIADGKKRQTDVSHNSSCKKVRLHQVYSWHDCKQLPIQRNSVQGFSNLGNTCYMNAILQSLFGLHVFTNDLLCNRDLKIFPESSLYYNLCQLFLSKKKHQMMESNLNHHLLNVKAAISSNIHRFSGNQQHDAHEFLLHVLDQLKEEIEKFSNRDDLSEIYVNPTKETFEFDIKHSIQCTECSEVTEKTEQFNDLSIEIPAVPPNRKVSLQDALDEFFQEDQISYLCEKCCGNSSFINHIFVKLPRVLILHIKRYRLSTLKNSETMIIPRYITLKDHCDSTTMTVNPVTPASFKLHKDPVNLLSLSDRKFKFRTNELLSTTEFLSQEKNRKPLMTLDDRMSLMSDDRMSLMSDDRMSLMSEEDEMQLAIEQSLTSNDVLSNKASNDVESEGRFTSIVKKWQDHPTPSRRRLTYVDKATDVKIDRNCGLFDSRPTTESCIKVVGHNSNTNGSDVEENNLSLPTIGSGQTQSLSTDHISQAFDSSPNNQDGCFLKDIDEHFIYDNKENFPPLKCSESDHKTPRLSSGLSIDDPIVLDYNQEEEDIRRAKELSLVECEDFLKQQNFVSNSTGERVKLFERSPSTSKELKLNYTGGHLPHSYRLVSVVSHIGSSSSFGHYISDVYNVRPEKWLSYDDSCVTSIPEDRVLYSRGNTGYIFFYLNKEIHDVIKISSQSSSL